MYRIMLVDDEENILKALKRALLVNRQWQVDTYNNVQEALKAAQTMLYEVIISDYRMPSMDGVEFLCQVKELQPDSVRIILSGQSDMSALIKAINDAEIFRFIPKPWTDYDLISTIELGIKHIEVVLENRRLVKQVSTYETKLAHVEKLHPKIFEVNRDNDGSILINEDDY